MNYLLLTKRNPYSPGATRVDFLPLPRDWVKWRSPQDKWGFAQPKRKQVITAYYSDLIEGPFVTDWATTCIRQVSTTTWVRDEGSWQEVLHEFTIRGFGGFD